jgi:hypothetical protein
MKTNRQMVIISVLAVSFAACSDDGSGGDLDASADTDADSDTDTDSDTDSDCVVLVDSAEGSDANDGSTWSLAKATVQALG